jgi:hypothetical protein
VRLIHAAAAAAAAAAAVSGLHAPFAQNGNVDTGNAHMLPLPLLPLPDIVGPSTYVSGQAAMATSISPSCCSGTVQQRRLLLQLHQAAALPQHQQQMPQALLLLPAALQLVPLQQQQQQLRQFTQSRSRTHHRCSLASCCQTCCAFKGRQYLSSWCSGWCSKGVRWML